MSLANPLVVLDRDWASYTRGTRFKVVQRVNCGEIQQADGKTVNPINLRAVLENEPVPADPLQGCRTVPEEYTVELPEVNEGYDVEANQGTRDGTVIAVCGTQFLVEYEMPAGRTFGRVFDVLRPGWHRAVCLDNLPKKWRKELAA